LPENADIIDNGMKFFHVGRSAVDTFEIDLTVPGLDG
jgi:hypothetical protein